MPSCSRPFHELLASAVSDPNALFDWLFCPYSIRIGITVVGAFLLVIVFVGLYNWSESLTLPLTWLALVAPLVATTALPGGLVSLIAGLVTFAFAMLLVGIWWWWGRD